MKLKEGILLTALTLAVISIIGTFSNVQAATATSPITLSLKALRSSGQGYKVTNNGEKYIWKIYNTNNDRNETFYCIKGGPGFGSSTMGNSIVPTEYKIYFDMKKTSEITDKYLSALPDTNSKDYERLMWVFDQCYVEPKTGASSTDRQMAEQNKQALLTAVEAYANQFPGVYDNTSWINNTLTGNLTDDDIDAIQQLAIWYYTNSDEYHIDGNPTIKINSVIGSDGSYTELDLNDDEDAARIHAMDALYNYLVKTPQATGFNYAYQSSSSSSKPVEIVSTNITTTTSGNRLIIGPYKIEELSNISYTLEGTFTDGKGNEITDIQYLDSNKNAVASGTTLKDLVGSNFYISIPDTTDTSNINFSITGKFFTTAVTYWSVENPTSTDQPIVQLEKTDISFSDEIDYEYVVTPEKYFDLALRKFIYSVNDVKLTGSDSREPVISDTTLQSLANGGTLTTEKVHTKTPVTVQKGDRVVYTIRVYNEGEIDGWATEITDYLPAGLKLVPTSSSTINQTYGWTSTDGKTVTTTYLASNDKKLTAFNKDTLELDYEDIQIECEVIATVNDTDQISNLTNIAEITAHKDVDENTGNIDRDSQPGNVTTNPDNYNPQNPTKGTGEQDDDDYERLVLPGQYFDLSLRKFITTVTNSDETKSSVIINREPVVDTSPLIDGTSTTAIYKHTKEPVNVSNGDIVTYTIRVYNEGKLDGYVTEITDHLPEQLEFIVTDDLNAKYGWTISSDGRTVTTDITSPNTTHSASRDTIYENRTTDTDKVLLKAFDGKEGSQLDYIDVQIRCRVKDNIDLYEKITNIADITGFTDSEGNVITDRDSQEDNVTLPSDTTLPEYKDSEIESGKEYIPGQQDDDDFEKLVLQRFDLALRKFITGVVDGETTTEITDRVPVFNKISDTEYTYEHTKEPVKVASGNIVIYTLRIFNEGNMDGYATKVKDDIPDGLEFLPDNSINTAFGWKMYKEDGTETTNASEASYIETDFLSKENEKVEGDSLIPAFNSVTMTTPNYKDLKIAFKVVEPNNSDKIIINQAQISDDSDANGDPVNDVDSEPDKWTEGEDDQDIEKIELKCFDLALRKFITEVKNEDGSNVKEITNRAPVFTVVDGKYTYEHTKEPVEVANSNIVTYTLRIFNEGQINGYASKIKDDIPDGLEFLPDDSTNIEFGWKMYKEDGTETTNASEASYIETDYLSKDNETADGDNLINAFDPNTMTMPDYKDIKIAFKVTEPNTSDRIIINQAQISDDSDANGDPVDDIDSEPDKWIEGQDDQDIEKIKVKYFDLSLKKWVTESIVTYDGKTTVTKSGHTGDENPEAPMKVEIQTANINKTTVKFKFKIKVTNEGEIAGYVKELIDYIPDGLKFVAEDNPKWTVSKDGKVTTDQLKDTLLQPGESATVDIVLTWINGKDNMGEKVNWAEISKDYNEYNSPDIDSTPGNNVKGEDDIDQAPVLLSPATGKVETYITLTLSCVAIIVGGVILIKKFVI